MRVAESLASLRSPWLNNVSHRLARGEGVRESFSEPLNRFFDLLLQTVETGDPAWLDGMLDEWVQSRTETELSQQESTLPQILDGILMGTFEVARTGLSEGEALDLMDALLPVYNHAVEYSTRKETRLHVENISRELEKARVTLERLDRSKSDFIAIAAHELKTPLTLIEGYAAMLRDTLPETRGDTQAALLLRGVQNGTHRLREIIDDMIDVSLIDNDLLSLHFQPLWPNRLIALLQTEFAEIVRQRNLHLEVRAFPGAEEMTFGDGERLFQALRNVFSNAIKYTPDGGRIRIDGRKLPGFLEITISDSGIGIDPEDQPRIFEKFGRVGDVSLHSSGKTKFKGGGPGLGLPIARGIIEAHGGTIWAESERRDEAACPGSIFHILLPLRKEPPDDKMARLLRPLLEGEPGSRGNGDGVAD